MKGFSKKIML